MKLKNASTIIMFRNISALIFGLLLLSSCSSDSSKSDTATGPEWIHQSTRSVDNGYIVYVDSEAGPNIDKSQFKAEGLALSDLANECSFIPKGTRIEDRYVQPGKYGSTAYIKIAVEFQDCTAAQKANDPDSIRRIANQSFMQQLKAYQDYVETGEIADRNTPMNVDGIEPLPPLPPQTQANNGNVQFYVMRQYVVYQKEVVVLSPPTAFAPQSPETQTFASNVGPAVQRIQTMQAANPELVNKPMAWSKIPDRPRMERPGNLRLHNNRAFQQLRPPQRPAPQRNYGGRGNGEKRPRRGRKHYQENGEGQKNE